MPSVVLNTMFVSSDTPKLKIGQHFRALLNYLTLFDVKHLDHVSFVRMAAKNPNLIVDCTDVRMVEQDRLK